MLRIAIVGAGRLGTALAIALTARGFQIVSLVSRRLRHAQGASDSVGGQILTLSIKQLDQLPPVRVIFITTADDAIEQTAMQLAASLKWRGNACTVLHASGALSSGSLSSLSAIGFHTGSMHPLISVSDPITGAVTLGQAHYCLEGEQHAVRVARSIVRRLGGRSFSIPTAEKALYHAAAVMSSGHLVALFDIATEMLISCGLSDKQARDALLPLMHSTLENLSHHAPARALTGTFARADIATVHKHLAALRSLNSRDAREVYALLGRRSLQLAKKSGQDAQVLQKIARALEAGGKAGKR